MTYVGSVIVLVSKGLTGPVQKHTARLIHTGVCFLFCETDELSVRDAVFTTTH